jgi:hypothetical protein
MRSMLRSVFCSAPALLFGISGRSVLFQSLVSLLQEIQAYQDPPSVLTATANLLPDHVVMVPMVLS